METWNIIPLTDGCKWIANKKRTLLRFSKRVKLDIFELFSKIEKRDVPLAYSECISEIYFTIMSSSIYGDYRDRKIRLNCNNDSLDEIDKTLAHELAHGLDDIENFSSDKMLMKEKRAKCKYIKDKNARKNVHEYVAVGFEIFYFGDRKEKKSLKKHNKKLYELVLKMHKKYKAKKKDTR